MMNPPAENSLPIINVAPLLQPSAACSEVASQIGQACRRFGFFYITNHGVSEILQQQLETSARQFFGQPTAIKSAISMERGGRAWRGYFPVGAELTSGQPDRKEGLYFGAELDARHPLVQAGTPLHGPNLFPERVPELRPAVLEYLAAMTQLGHTLLRGIALSLGLPDNYFAARYTGDPLILFRIFNYPAEGQPESSWGVGEHTDYGLLTILKQDETGGLQVKTPAGWLNAPPLPNTFVCNLGDMLDRLTGGLYCSTPHRVRNVIGRDRLSFPFFFDPNFHAEIEPLPLEQIPLDDHTERWDRANIHAFRGTYGDYLLAKVARVFPQLRDRVL
jgi:isopenicillin N synthase-like dioxygenase